MANYSTPLNDQAITEASGYAAFIRRLIDATLEELDYQQQQYFKQRDSLAEMEGPDYKSTRLKFLAKTAEVEGTNWTTEYIYWGWSIWLGDGWKTKHISSENRKDGSYSQKVLRAAVKAKMGKKKVASWEVPLAFAFEVQRLRPLRNQLKILNNLLSQIRRVPYTPDLDRGPVDFVGMPVETE